MEVGICLSGKAYLPEAYAYAAYLNRLNMRTEVGPEKELSASNDIRIRFMGFDPILFGRQIQNKMQIVHEYGSLSVPPIPRIKDFFKAALNVRPHARIFQSKQLDQILSFRDNIPHIFRDMGVDSGFFENPDPYPAYDLVYAGYERPGLLNVIKRLTGFGIKVLAIGEFSKEFRSTFKVSGKVDFTGRLPQKDIPGLYRKCRLGLNYTPAVYPYRFQTSTKTLEYCAAGLGVISNKYQWAEQFCQQRDARFLWIEDCLSMGTIEKYCFKVPDVSDLEWGRLLDKVRFADFLHLLVDSPNSLSL